MDEHPIKAYRRKHKLTLEQFAERVGTSISTISRIENGKLKPTLDMLHSLVDATDGKVKMAAIIASTPRAA